MAGLEDSGVKTAKTGADPSVSDTICYACDHCDIHLARIHHHKHNSLSHSPQRSLWPLAGLVSSLRKSLSKRQKHHYHPINHHLPPPHPRKTKPHFAVELPTLCEKTKMASHNTTTLPLSLARPSPMGSYRSPRKSGLVHLKAPSDFLAQLSLASNNATANTATATTASSSTNPSTPNRTSTPTGSKEGVPARLENSSSRAASAAPADRTADRVTMPTEPAAHGAPTRQYLNSKVTYHVMEGMKIVAKEQ